MIDLSPTDQQREVQRAAVAFAEREILPRVRELDASGSYDERSTSGLVPPACWAIPEGYGGAGMDYIGFALFCEEMERADTPFRVIVSVHRPADVVRPADKTAGAPAHDHDQRRRLTDRP